MTPKQLTELCEAWLTFMSLPKPWKEPCNVPEMMFDAFPALARAACSNLMAMHMQGVLCKTHYKTLQEQGLALRDLTRLIARCEAVQKGEGNDD